MVLLLSIHRYVSWRERSVSLIILPRTHKLKFDAFHAKAVQ